MNILGVIFLLIALVLHSLRWFVIKKDYSFGSFLVVIILIIALAFAISRL